MPFFGQSVVVSDAQTYIAADQLTAINLAINNAPGNRATVIPRYPVWPSITKYVNDNSVFNNVFPEYIWDSTTMDNQVRAFAARGGAVGTESETITLSVSLTVFADNAHIARVDVYDFNGIVPVFVETITPPVLVDGSLDANTGLIETLPLNWQNIRIYNNQSSALPGDGLYGIIVSFTAVNYLGPFPPVTPGNPAGLMFYAHVGYSN